MGPLFPLVALAVVQAETPAFTAADFAHLRRLEGRWVGTSPEGRPVREDYAFPDATTMRIRRSTGAEYVVETFGRTISLSGGRIVARWGSYSWRAVEAGPERIRFVPDGNAPTAFSWRFLADGAIEARQEWIATDGAPRTYALTMRRAVP